MAEESKHIVHHVDSGNDRRGVRMLRSWQFLAAAFAVLLVASIATSGFGLGESGALSREQVSNKAADYINKNILHGQGVATVADVQESNGLYSLTLNVAGQVYDSYATRDGSLLFPQAINLDEEPVAQAASAAAPSVPKSEKPKVELFVMSHCPYGTQMEKGMLPVVKALGPKIDFDVKFVNYAMHGKVEIDEETRQYCIQKEFGGKYLAYLGCFLEDGNSSRCIGKEGIYAGRLDACVAETDAEYGISKSFSDATRKGWAGNYPPFRIFDAENNKYGVQGSPTLVINGQMANSGRDAQSLLNVICGAFSQEPEECSMDMSSYGNPAPGFGFGTQGGSATTAGCGG